MRTIAQIEQAAERSWAQGQLADRERADRQALMQKPSPGDQRLFTPTKCKVLRPFCVKGQRQEIGTEVLLAKFDAESLKALGKVEIL